MKTTKRIFAILLSLLVLVGLFAVAASAEGDSNKTCKCSKGHEMRLIIDQSCNEVLKEGEKNYMVFVCDVCSETKRVEGKRAHEEIIINGKESTCTENGLSEGLQCKVCGKITKEQTVTEKKPHVDNGNHYCANCKTDMLENRCAYCDQEHGTDFGGRMTAFFHSIALFFRNMFNR